jgi:trk system potassium uptake protein TrkH
MPFNIPAILRALGFIIGINGTAMIPALLCALYFNETKAALALAFCGGASALLGFVLLRFSKQKRKSLSVRDGYLIVSVSWILCSLIGAVPYILSGEIPVFVDALFESVSGYTTTGATVVSDWNLSHGMLLWEATTNWLGGMAILMFIISVLPMFGTGGHRVAYAEASWSSYTRTSPRISDLSRTIFMIYIALTVVAFVLLSTSDMDWFEALINSLASVSNAGMLLHPGGMDYYRSFYIECVITFITVLASINFVMYLYLIQRNFRDIRQNVELRVFLAIIAVVTLVIGIDLFNAGVYGSLSDSFRHAFFQVAAISTTSGYAIGNPNVWPVFSKTLLFCLFFIGGCAASTSGSIKVIRIVVLFKLVSRGFVKRLHSHAICAVKMGKKNIPSPMVSTVVAFICLYGFTYLMTALILSLQNLDFETTLSAAAALLSNTSFAFGDLVYGNFSAFANPFLKCFMCLVMLIGRLELFSIFLLFIPSFWNSDKSV